MPTFEKLAPVARKSFDLEFKPEVTAEELHATLDRLLELAGCPACGLNGIDIRFAPEFDLRAKLDLPSLATARLLG